jgi:hypothetical protein
MKTIFKYAVAATLAGALALAAASPSEARGGRNAAAIGGFAAGALIGAAVVGSQYNNGYYGPGYYDPGYAYAPGYAYESDYAYEPAPVYVQPGPTYYSRPYYRSNSNCNSSPASPSYGTAC